MDDRAQQLVAGHLAGSLTSDEGEELVHLAKESAEVRDELARQATLDRWLHLHAARPLDAEAILKALPRGDATADRVIQRLPRRSRPRPTRRPALAWWGAAAAAAMVFITIAVWSLTPAPAGVFQVVALTGDHAHQHAGTTSAIRLSSHIAAGDVLRLTEPGTVRLQARDGTTLDLDAAASITVLADQPERLELSLERGRAVASVTPRSGEGRFTIRTPHAVVVVVGTRFTVDAGPNRTRLDVAEGKVRFTPLGEPTREVTGGGSAEWPVAAAASSTPEKSRNVDLVPVADADADGAVPGTSFGREPTLRQVAATTAKERVSLLRFVVPAGRITHAELVLHRRGGAGTAQVRIQSQTGGWEENDLRYYHLPARGRVIGVLKDQQAGGAWRCDVTSAIQPGVVEFMVENTAATELSFASREDTVHAPILRLTLSEATSP